jgi:exopolysaccharide biosynthesis polyprenyl glycosylphosphotransferase
MINEALPNLLMRHYAMAETVWGRSWLNLQVKQECLRAAWEDRGADTLKRAFDIAFSFLVLLALSPLLLLIMFLIKAEDGGPVLFSQTRVGEFGREFKMYKFRSMCLNAEQRLQELLGLNEHKEGVTFKLKNDPRITKVGRWLRKFSLDELPQFYNVLIGDMSLVGPRPPVPRETELYTPAQRRRLAVKPGITCTWQISGRSNIDFSGQVKLDVMYIENRNFLMDMKIIVQTVPAVLSGRGAC